jgi:hypothetical protein
MAAAGILLWSYMVYILQKLFTYKVILDDDHMEIHKLDSVLTVRFEDIIHIHRKRSVCYIIDRVMDDGEYYIRGVKPPMKYSQGIKKVKIRFSRLPALQRAYVENYQDIVKTIISKVKLDSITVNK